MRYLWQGNQPGQRHLHTKHGSHSTYQKKFGGLGLQNLQLFDIALLAKIAWRLADPTQSSLWKNILLAKYARETHIWNNKAKTNDSALWKELTKIFPTTRVNSNHFIGNEEMTNIWKDNWIPNHPHNSLKMPSQVRHTPTIVSELSNQQNNWRLDLIHGMFPIPTATAITKIHITNNMEKLILTPDPKGSFSTVK